MLVPIDRNDLSFWVNGPDPRPCPPLVGERRADVAIVGGGFLGLSTAYHLVREQPGLDVVVLEAGVVGSGASGRNTGIVRAGTAGSIRDLRRRFPEEETQRLYQVTVDAVDCVRRMIQTEGLDCDWEEVNHIKAALTGRHARCLRTEAALLDRLGFGGEYLGAEAIADAVPSRQYVAGLRYSDSAQINPAKLCRELKRVLLERGVSVHEMSAVRSVTPGRPVALEVADGRVIADRVVLGTNAYLPQLGVLRGRVIPLQTHVRVTEPLSEAQLAALGWSRRESISDKRNIFHYYRLTRDNRIVFGGGRPVYGRAGGNRVDGATDVADPRVWGQQRRAFAALFPSLQGVRTTHEWSGSLGMTADMLPVIGRPDGMPGVTVAGGWSGHGVALALASGALVADLLAGRDAETLSLPWLRSSAPRIPGDPLRAVGLSAYVTGLQWADACGALFDRLRRRPLDHPEPAPPTKATSNPAPGAPVGRTN